jgi:hypothetical protein
VLREAISVESGEKAGKAGGVATKSAQKTDVPSNLTKLERGSQSPYQKSELLASVGFSLVCHLKGPSSKLFVPHLPCSTVRSSFLLFVTLPVGLGELSEKLTRACCRTVRELTHLIVGSCTEYIRRGDLLVSYPRILATHIMATGAWRVGSVRNRLITA